MGKHIHRKHAVGMNDAHRSNILRAAVTGDGERLAFALHAITGTRRAHRQNAALIIGQFMRSGGELPLPDISGTGMASTHSIPLSQIESL